VPDPDDAVALLDGPRAYLRRLRNRAVVVGDLVALAVRAEAPGVVRAADRVALELAVVDHIGRGVLGQMSAHMRAIGIEQHDLAALAAVERHFLAEVTDRERLI